MRVPTSLILILFLLQSPLCRSEVRSVDGGNNHFPRDARGSVGDTYLRVLPRNVSRGTARAALPSARLISNLVLDAWLPHHSGGSSPVAGDKASTLTGLFAFYGQWLTFDLTHAKTNSSEKWPIDVPRCDAQLDPDCSATSTIGFSRTVRRPGGGGGEAGEQFNANTGFIDAEQVYGNNKARSDALRTFKGGLLRSRVRGREAGSEPIAGGGAGGSGEKSGNDIAAEEYLPLGSEPSAAGHAIGNPMELAPSSLFFTGNVRANVLPQILAFQ